MLFIIPAASAGESLGLAQNKVRAAMRPFMQGLRDCVSRQHKLDPGVKGRLELSFTIGNRGKVTRVELLTGEHARTYVAGCADGVIRSIEFPKFSGQPVVVPKFPIVLESQEAPAFPPRYEDDEEKPPSEAEAPRKFRAKVRSHLKPAAATIRACIRDHQTKSSGKKRKRRRRRKKSRIGPLSLDLTLNPLGHVMEVQLRGNAHQKDHVAGCVTGVLTFVEFPALGSEALRYSRMKLSLPKQP
jgi:hypothetical protein